MPSSFVCGFEGLKSVFLNLQTKCSPGPLRLSSHQWNYRMTLAQTIQAKFYSELRIQHFYNALLWLYRSCSYLDQITACPVVRRSLILKNANTTTSHRVRIQTFYLLFLLRSPCIDQSILYSWAQGILLPQTPSSWGYRRLQGCRPPSVCEGRTQAIPARAGFPPKLLA